MIEATPNPVYKEQLMHYLSQAPAVFKRYGALPIASYDIESALKLDANNVSEDTSKSKEVPGVIAVLSFPNKDSILTLFNSPEYQALVPYRDLAFNDVGIYIGNERI
jgi:uncharacterized protein (DUF1330 family)